MDFFAVVDCDNCYVSCERVFRPDLNGKPVVVLSNNDGCVVARSNEAKRMGIKAGTPFFKLAQQFPDQKIAVFSSNYELYGALTARVLDLESGQSLDIAAESGEKLFGIGFFNEDFVYGCAADADIPPRERLVYHVIPQQPQSAGYKDTHIKAPSFPLRLRDQRK